jgi:tape measure domain-containing protein
MPTVEIEIDINGYAAVSAQLREIGKIGVGVEKQFVDMNTKVSKSVAALNVYLKTSNRFTEMFNKTFAAVEKNLSGLQAIADTSKEKLDKYIAKLDQTKDAVTALKDNIHLVKAASTAIGGNFVRASDKSVLAIKKISTALKDVKSELKSPLPTKQIIVKDSPDMAGDANKVVGQLVKGLGSASTVAKKFSDSINLISLSIQTLGRSTKRSFDQIKTSISSASAVIKKDLKAVETTSKTATRNVIKGINETSLSAQTMTSSVKRSFGTLGTNTKGVIASLKTMRQAITSTSTSARGLVRTLSNMSVSMRGVGSGSGSSKSFFNIGPLKEVSRVLSSLRIIALQAWAAIAGYGFVDKLIENAKKVDQLNFSFKAITGSTAAARDELDFIRKTADNLGLVFYDLADSYKIVAAAARGTSLEGKGVRDLFETISGVGAVMGASMEDLGRVFLQLQQGIGRNKFQLEDLKRIMDALPGVTIKDLAKAVNLTGYEFYQMVRKGRLISESFIPELVKGLQDKFGPAIEESKNRFSSYVNSMINAWNDFLEAVNASFGREVLKSAIEGITAALKSMGKGALENKDIFQEIGSSWKQTIEGLAEVLSDNKDINKWLKDMFSDPSSGEMTFRSIYQNLSMLFTNFLANVEIGFIKAMGYAEKFNAFLKSLHPSEIKKGMGEQHSQFWKDTGSGKYSIIDFFKNIGKEAEVTTEKVSKLQQKFDKIDKSVLDKLKDVDKRAEERAPEIYKLNLPTKPKMPKLMDITPIAEPPPDQDAANTEKSLDRLKKKLEGITDTMRDKQLSVFDAAREKVKDLTLELNDFAKKGSNIEKFPELIKAAFDQINKAEIDKTIKDADKELEKLYEKMNPEKKTTTVFDEARDKIYEVIAALNKLKSVGATKDPMIANLKSTKKEMEDYIAKLNEAKNKADASPVTSYSETIKKWIENTKKQMPEMEKQKKLFESLIRMTPDKDPRSNSYKESLKEQIKNIEDAKKELDAVLKDSENWNTKQEIPKEVILKLIPIIENRLKLDADAKELAEKGVEHFQDAADKLGPRQIKFDASTAYNELYGVQEENLKKSNRILEGLRLQNEEDIAAHLNTVNQLERSGLSDAQEIIRKRHILRVLELQKQEEDLKAVRKLEEDALLWENKLSSKEAVSIGFKRAATENKKTDNQLSAATGAGTHALQLEYFGDYEAKKTELKNQLEFLNKMYEDEQKKELKLDEASGEEKLKIMEKIYIQQAALIELNQQQERENELKHRKMMRDIYLNTETGFSFGDVWGGMQRGFADAVDEMRMTWRQFGAEIGKTFVKDVGDAFGKTFKNISDLLRGKTRIHDYSGELSSIQNTMQNLRTSQGGLAYEKRILEMTGQTDTSAYDEVSEKLDEINDKIADQAKLFEEVAEKAKNSYKDLFDFIGSGFDDVWSNMASGFFSAMGGMAAAWVFEGTGHGGTGGTSGSNWLTTGLAAGREYIKDGVVAGWEWGMNQWDSWWEDSPTLNFEIPDVNLSYGGAYGHSGLRAFHEGSKINSTGLKSDEFPAILQTGEAVLPRQMVKQIYDGNTIGKEDLDSLPRFHSGAVIAKALSDKGYTLTAQDETKMKDFDKTSKANGTRFYHRNDPMYWFDKDFLSFLGKPSKENGGVYLRNLGVFKSMDELITYITKDSNGTLDEYWSQIWPYHWNQAISKVKDPKPDASPDSAVKFWWDSASETAGKEHGATRSKIVNDALADQIGAENYDTANEVIENKLEENEDKKAQKQIKIALLTKKLSELPALMPLEEGLWYGINELGDPRFNGSELYRKGYPSRTSQLKAFYFADAGGGKVGIRKSSSTEKTPYDLYHDKDYLTNFVTPDDWHGKEINKRADDILGGDIVTQIQDVQAGNVRDPFIRPFEQTEKGMSLLQGVANSQTDINDTDYFSSPFLMRKAFLEGKFTEGLTEEQIAKLNFKDFLNVGINAAGMPDLAALKKAMGDAYLEENIQKAMGSAIDLPALQFQTASAMAEEMNYRIAEAAYYKDFGDVPVLPLNKMQKAALALTINKAAKLPMNLIIKDVLAGLVIKGTNPDMPTEMIVDKLIADIPRALGMGLLSTAITSTVSTYLGLDPKSRGFVTNIIGSLAGSMLMGPAGAVLGGVAMMGLSEFVADAANTRDFEPYLDAAEDMNLGMFATGELKYDMRKALEQLQAKKFQEFYTPSEDNPIGPMTPEYAATYLDAYSPDVIDLIPSWKDKFNDPTNPTKEELDAAAQSVMSQYKPLEGTGEWAGFKQFWVDVYDGAISGATGIATDLYNVFADTPTMPSIPTPSAPNIPGSTPGTSPGYTGGTETDMSIPGTLDPAVFGWDEGIWANIKPIPGLQTGGGVKAGELYKVGEAGWEYFVPSTDGEILNHQQSKMIDSNKTAIPMASGSIFGSPSNQDTLQFSIKAAENQLAILDASLTENTSAVDEAASVYEYKPYQNTIPQGNYFNQGEAETRLERAKNADPSTIAYRAPASELQNQVKGSTLSSVMNPEIQAAIADLNMNYSEDFIEDMELLLNIFDEAGKAVNEFNSTMTSLADKGFKDITKAEYDRLDAALSGLTESGVDPARITTGLFLGPIADDLKKDWGQIPGWIQNMADDTFLYVKDTMTAFNEINWNDRWAKNIIASITELQAASELMNPIIEQSQKIQKYIDPDKAKAFIDKVNEDIIKANKGKPIEEQQPLEEMTWKGMTGLVKGWENLNKALDYAISPVEDLQAQIEAQTATYIDKMNEMEEAGIGQWAIDEFMAKLDVLKEKMTKDFWREFTDKFDAAVKGLIITGSKFQNEYDDLNKQLTSYIDSLKTSGYATEEITKLEAKRTEALKALEKQYQDAIKATLGEVDSYMAEYNVGGITDFQITLNKIDKDFDSFKQTLSELGATEEVLTKLEQDRLATLAAAVEMNKEAISDAVKEMDRYTANISGGGMSTFANELEKVNDDFDKFVKTLKSLGAAEEVLALAELKRIEATQAKIKAEQDSINAMRAGILGLSESLKVANIVERYGAGRNTDKETGKVDVYDLASASMTLAGGSSPEDIMAFAEKMGVSPEKLMEDVKYITDMYHSIVDPFVEIQDAVKTWEMQLDETVKGSEIIAAKMMEWKSDRGLPGEVYDMAAMNIDQYKEYADMMAEYVSTQISELQSSYIEFKDFSDSLEDMVTQIKKDEGEKGLSTVQLAQRRDETIVSKTAELQASINTGDLEALDSQLELAGELKDLIEERYNMEADSIKELEDALKSVNDKIIELRYSSYNLAVPTQKAEVAAIDYDKMFAAAKTGGAEDINEYLGFINTYLEQAQSAYKSSEKYQMIWDQVNKDLVSLGVTTEDAMTKEEMLLNSTVSQLESLNIAIESLLGKDGPINKTIQNLLSNEGPIGKYGDVEGALDLAKLPIENTLEADIVQKNQSTTPANDSSLIVQETMAGSLDEIKTTQDAVVSSVQSIAGLSWETIDILNDMAAKAQTTDKEALEVLKAQLVASVDAIASLSGIQLSVIGLDSTMADMASALSALPEEISSLYSYQIPVNETPVPLTPIYTQTPDSGSETTVKATINITLEGGEVLTFHDIEIIADEVTTLKARRNKLAERIYL